MLTGCSSWFVKEDTRTFSFEDVLEYKRRYDQASKEYYSPESFDQRYQNSAPQRQPQIRYSYPVYDSSDDNPAPYQQPVRPSRQHQYPKFNPDEDNPDNQGVLFNKPMFN